MGSIFTVRFAAATPALATPPDTRDAREHILRREALTGLRVLIVDDDGNSRDMLQQALECAGADVQAAASVREALEKIPPFRPHAMVSDIGMPQEDGYDLLRLVRALPPESGGATPAIALTGYARDKDRAATKAAGYQAVAAKPVNLEELFSAIARLAAR
jgi:CheY-like chemotaxis protein